MNYSYATDRMSVHQDKDESDASLAAGHPVVSISIGDAARFLFGGVRRKDAVEAFRLESGDAFVFGGPARLRHHGVSRIAPGTAPPELAFTGRFNLTFRQF
jgi:alkylated DNA repair protein (DNA oxidative demethylase)